MIDVIRQFEAVPAAYPDAPAGLSTEAAALDASAIWARIEAYTAYRFTVREVVWTLCGDGEWSAPLTPVVSRVCHVWKDDAWELVTLKDGPFGICVPDFGSYRVTAQVGAGDAPAPIMEAFRRLAEYLAHGEHNPGASAFKMDLGVMTVEEETRAPTWVARAMQLSGAADLLRPYRRA